MEPNRLFADDVLHEPLTLFRCHFMLFNALYELRDRWLKDRTGLLHIHTTRIHLAPYPSVSGGIDAADPLREYYLNWENFAGTDRQDVESLLDDFWQRMGGRSTTVAESGLSITEACKVMGVSYDALTLPLLKRQYRRLQHQYHPDKGGSEEKAQQLIAAYETLYRYVK